MNLVSSLISFAAQYLTEILSRPFQRIYTIQQTKKILNGIQKNFKSKSEITKVFDTISEIKNKEGYIGFWKCLLYTSTKNWIYFPLKSSFEDIFKPLRNAFDPNEQYEYFVMNKAALDALATACATAFTHPIDCAILKSSSIVGNVANTPQEEILINKGIFKYIKHVVHTQRISSLYIGFGFRIGTSFYENIICKIFDILFWNYLFSNVEHSKKSSSILHQICLCCTWLFTYPVHLVTSKIMVQMGDDPNTQKNPLEIIKSIWENQGILGFYEGGLVNLLLCLILNSFNNKRIPEDI